MTDSSQPHDPSSFTPASPAERALEQAESAFGAHLAITPRERASLLRQVARRLGADKTEINEAELLHALCQVRRRSWASGMMNRAHRNGDVWVRKADVLLAAERISDPLIDENGQNAVLESVLEERWRDMADTPLRVLDDMRADFADVGTFLSGTQIERLSHSIARAFGGVDLGFEDEMILEEERRAREQEDIRARAEARRARELQKIRDWEATLVGFEKVPALLHCSRREALRWIAENRIPVAKRDMQPDGLEIFHFDPAELKKCRPLLNSWRRGTGQKESDGYDDSPQARKGNAAIARVAALDRFAAHFRTARALKRRITLVTGPTNSGKSHTALEALAQAESGLALAPLRLLAHEFREAMLSRGVPASLTTGEERIIDPTARHLAATVEMCPFSTPVDVAIIDEAQMLSDPDRGAAWTAAIMGVPARHVFILGAADCIPLVKRIAELCNDPVDEIHLERKSPLRPAGTLALTDLRAGDALIA
ncbi:MAG: RNA helicase, partial [Bombella apis]|nr:RNA helicase [Bombella apis]